MPLAEALDALLPQIQCTRCGFGGCRPYAEAVAAGCADINRCAPGGQAGVDALAARLGVPTKRLDPAYGAEQPLRVARIDEAACIGCTLCIQACPVDAIIGAARRMHTVVAEWCTGCDLCIDPCPVDCIAMIPAGRSWTHADADAARERHGSRRARRQRIEALRAARLAARSAAKAATVAADVELDPVTRKRKLAVIQAAIERARARRAAAGDAEPGR